MNAIIDGFCGCFHSNPSHGMMARDENHFYSEPSRKINKNRNIFAKKRKNSRRKAFIHHIMGFITNILTQCLPAVLLCVDWNWNWNSNTPTWCNFVFYLCLSNKRQFFSVQFFLLPSPCFFFDLLGQAHHHVRPLHISTTNNINRKNVSKKAHVSW